MYSRQTLQSFTAALILAVLTVTSLFLVAHANETVVPLGPDQSQIRSTYRAAFEHISQGGRLHWSLQGFNADGTTYSPGTLVAPDGIDDSNYDTTMVSGTVNAGPALALHTNGTQVAVFRSTVTDPTYGSAGWEVADVREALDNYLWGALDYDILDETALADEDLSQYAILIIPSMRWGNEQEVVDALSQQALNNINDFVEAGGFLYAQSNGAIIAEAAGVIGSGTVDLENSIELAEDAELNAGMLSVLTPDSPLTLSWVEETLYVLTDPVYNPGDALTTVAEFTNLQGANLPAIVSGVVGEGHVILVNGHPTAPSHREQLPLFFNALMWSLGQPGEIYGQAVQTYDPTMPPNVVPAYEAGIEISTTLTFANVWDAPLNDVVVATTVTTGFLVKEESISPAAQVTTSDAGTLIVWDLGNVDPGEVTLSFVAETDDQVMSGGNVTFATSEATFNHRGKAVTVTHPAFTLTSRMAARLLADRDVELDRHLMMPKEGLYLDVDIPIENKEESLASQVVVTDVVICLAPVVNIDDQSTILDPTGKATFADPLAGEAVWVRNEPFFYDETEDDGSPDRPYIPADGYAPGDSISLDECDTQGAFIVPDGIYGHGRADMTDPTSPTQTLSDTMPLSATDYISVTDDGILLLPTKVLTWTVGDWPGYHYEEPAIRYGIHSNEMNNRAVIFQTEDMTGSAVLSSTVSDEAVIIAGSGGSVYTHMGEDPVTYHEHVTSGEIYVPTSDVMPMISYQDIWSRTNALPFRAAFYDIFTCNGCSPDAPPPIDKHAALNVTFEMRADTDGDGARDDRVLTLPTNLEGVDLNIIIKEMNMGDSIPDDQMVIDMGMFKGLGINIVPATDDWATSWSSSNPNTQLVAVESEGGYDHLYFQHSIPASGGSEVTLQAQIENYSDAEGMFKLHDGARLTYRQQEAGPSRYEVYDTRVQGIIGEAPNLEVEKRVTPIQVSTYGDTIYYTFYIDDRNDPRRLERNGPADPFLQSYGFSDTAATTYVGGREDRQVLHSIVERGEQTRIRVEVNNNSGDEWSNVSVMPEPPDGITVEPLYTNLDSVPAPIYYDLPFLHVETIPDAGRGVYYFDVSVDENYGGPRGGLVEIPVNFSADNAPDDFEIPAAQLGIEDENGNVYHVYGMPENLELKDMIPDWVEMQKAAVVSDDDVTALSDEVTEEDQASIFDNFPETIAFTAEESGEVMFELPGDSLDRIYNPAGERQLIVVAQATISPTQVGPNIANEGALITYQDQYGMEWDTRSNPVTVEVHGAKVEVDYTCGSVITTPVEIDETDDLTDTDEIDETDDLTDTDEIDETDDLTDTDEIDETDDLTDTDEIDETDDLTDTDEIDETDDLTGTDDLDETDTMTDTDDLDETDTMTDTEEATDPEDEQETDTEEPIASDEEDATEEEDDPEFMPGRSGATFFSTIANVDEITDTDEIDETDDLTDTDTMTDTDDVEEQQDEPGECVLSTNAENEIVLEAVIYNAGDYPSQDTSASLTLPDGIIINESTRNPDIDGQTLTWNVGDLAPGGKVFVQISTTIKLDENATIVDELDGETDGPVGRSMLAGIPESVQVIDYTDGRFFETFSQSWVETRLAEVFRLPVQSGEPNIISQSNLVYLPVVGNFLSTVDPGGEEPTPEPTPEPALPDLVVTEFSVTPANLALGEAATVKVVVENQGEGGAGPFWVDFYISPDPVPNSAGIRWDTVCSVTPCDGIAWEVTGLQAGESVVLTSDSFAPDQTVWSGGFRAPGTHDLYVYVDSWNEGQITGAVDETAEANNRAELLGVQVIGEADPLQVQERVVLADR